MGSCKTIIITIIMMIIIYSYYIYNMLYESITIHLTNKKEVPKTMIKPSA